MGAENRRAVPFQGFLNFARQRWATRGHGRTLEQGYRGAADWNAIARAVEIPRPTDTLLIGNGDVQNLDDVFRRIRQTGVDGVLVGRGAQGDPWMFQSKDMTRVQA